MNTSTVLPALLIFLGIIVYALVLRVIRFATNLAFATFLGELR